MNTAVIAGTGIAAPLDEIQVTPVGTPYGIAYVAEHLFGGQEVTLLARHGPGLNVPPHLINYQANLWALRELGVRRILATAAVGSVRRDLPPGSLAVVTDFLDLTKRRPFTFCDRVENTVMHTDFSEPYCPVITSAIRTAAAEAGFGELLPVTYTCMEGPRYETPAEIRMIASLGGDVVGMTGVPEVVLARELGLCYGTLAIVTNFAAGISPAPLAHEEVVASVSEQGPKVREVIGRTIYLINEREVCTNCDAGRQAM